MTTLALVEPNRSQFQVNNATGRLTRDPELRQLLSGSVCQMRVAIDRMGRNGQTGYINVASFGTAGEAAAQFLSKGSPVAINGRLEYQEWKAPDGRRAAATP